MRSGGNAVSPEETPAAMASSDSCLFVLSDQCVIVCPLSLPLLLPVTPEAIGFLSAVGVFIVALAILFLFINKKLCFSRVGGLPCLEQHGRHKSRRQGVLQGLVSSYDYDDEAASSSSDSEDEVLKQFEISMSRSQSFRVAAASRAPETSHQIDLALSRRHKFTRLSEQEEGSTEPSDCEAEAEASDRQTIQDPFCAVERKREKMSAPPPNSPAAAAEGSPILSTTRPAAEGSEDTSVDQDSNKVTDSSSNWGPEHKQTLHSSTSSQLLCSSSPPPVCKCGDLVLSLEYRPSLSKLLVSVFSARDVPDRDRSGLDSWQVHMLLLPSKKQRHKTSVQKGPHPHFNETLRFSHVEPTDLHRSAVRFRLYALGRRMSRERMVGEKVFCLGGLDTRGGTMETTLVLEPRSNLKHVGSQSDIVSCSQSLTHGGVPELLLGLSYNSTTGRMSVELIKGSLFRNLTVSKPPDTFGRLTLLNSVGQEIARCKTTVRRGQPNPVYKETFVFQVALFQLSDVTLLVSIYNRRNMKRKEMVGWIALGQNSSGKEEQLHWQDMKESQGQQVCRWHVLLEA